MILEFDNWIDSRPRPNLAVHQARPLTPKWRQFSLHWPFSEPLNLWEWLQDEQVNFDYRAVKFYPVAVSFFDFSINWIDLLPAYRRLQLQSGKISFLLYYSEGDNPMRIQNHLVKQFETNGISPQNLYIISANSAADDLPRCAWFVDDELLFRKRNRFCPALPFHSSPRKKLFTALVRTHKWWRACTMAELWRKGLHDHGYFSYNPTLAAGDSENDNPIEIDQFDSLREHTHEFIKHRFQADPWSEQEHNDHHRCFADHFTDSYINVVLETHMDVDQSNGVFITEKTFKPIKHAQPFVVFGAANSLAKLRELGYRTFDSVLDNSYDSISDTTQRWAALQTMLQQHLSQGHDHMHKLLLACRSDCEHNQKHFLDSKQRRLNRLVNKLLCK